jgi:ribonuclease P protein component
MAARLSGPGAFKAIFDKGSRREGRYVQVVFLPASFPPEAPSGRFGFVVGRKAVRRAVDRNRFKRVVREHLRRIRERVSGLDLVIRVKRPLNGSGVDAAAAEAVALVEGVAAVAPAR